MELLASYFKPGVFDAYTFVCDGRDAQSGYYTMLGMSADGRSFCQWTEGIYDPTGDNAHLGGPVDAQTLDPVVRDELRRHLRGTAPARDERKDGDA